MPKKAKELSALEVKRLTQPGAYAVGGVAGLVLQVTDTGARSWLLRYRMGARRPEIGLGGFPDVPLADAREKARALRQQIVAGIDPAEERKALRLRVLDEQRQSVIFERVARDCYEVKQQEFRNKKHAWQWLASLEKYVFPALGNQRIDAITTQDILGVLKPIWPTIPETAGRVRQRIAAVFDYAKAASLRAGDNPAAWRGCLEPLLPKNEVMKRRKGMGNQPAIAIRQVPELYSDLRRRSSISALALRFVLLTACRSGEARLAEWGEVDFQAGVWTIPAERMKAGKTHVVPLTSEALNLLRQLPRLQGCALLFPGQQDRPLSDMTLNKMLKDLNLRRLDDGLPGYLDPTNGKVAVPHGLRSTFKDWARKFTAYPDEVSELQLAHVSSDATRAAYARDALLEKRRQLMDEWQRFCSQGHSPASITPLQHRYGA